ncbi:MAG: SCO family protein [Desulfuromonadales bacterium]|nr:SCO family protein [Desulfuromonadales bacterium]
MRRHQTSRVLLLLVVLLSLPLVVQAEAKKRYQRSVHKYTVPEATLVNQEGRKVLLTELLAADKPVMVDFIYGTCTTICPVLSAGYSNLQRRLGPAAQQVQLVSITIDPEYDTPEVMTEYLQRYNRQPGWDFLTGSRADIDRVMRAFNAYVPNKMSHYPLTLLRGPGEERWVRIYGLLGTADLMSEYEQLLRR